MTLSTFMTMNLFEKYPASEFLKSLPEDSDLCPLRARIKDLFSYLDGLEDPHFEQGLDQDPYARLWEMMLAKILRCAGHEPTSAPRGPDFLIEMDGYRVFIEAICPGPGDESNPNSVPPMPSDAEIAQKVPIPQIVLRIRSAMEEKRRKHTQYLERALVSARDIYVIAVNSSRIGRTSGLRPPAILQATHALGNPYVIFGQDGAMVSEGIESRESIQKVNGQEIDTTFLLSERNRLISGVLYSDCSVFSLDFDLYKESMYLHNPKAQTILPLRFFRPVTDVWTVCCEGSAQWRAYRVGNI